MSSVIDPDPQGRMPISVALDAHGLIHMVGDGDIVFGEFVAIVDEIYQTEELAGVGRLLCDLRAARIMLSAAEVRELVGHVRAERRPGKRRSAIVASEDLAFGMSRMFGAWTESSFDGGDIEVRVFRDIDAATTWLFEG